jgi:hypothetical protein
MATASYFYKGLQVWPLVYPRRPTKTGQAHNYDEGFDAAVRIDELQKDGSSARSRVLVLPADRAFANGGDARRASVAFARRMIDDCAPGQTVWDGA